MYKNKIGNLKTMAIDKLEEKMSGCPCFPCGRRKVHHRSKNTTTIPDAEEERRNLKPPDTPSTPPVYGVQNVHSEKQKKVRHSEPLRGKSQRRDMLEDDQSKTGEQRLSSPSKYVIPQDAIVNKGRAFTYKELIDATNNFDKDAFLGEGGFGEVYKGKLESTGQVVAVKKLSQEGVQGNNEFRVEVTMLSLVCHPNIVTLIGYCSERDQRLLVYEFMTFGSLEQHLHYPRSDVEPLNWNTRMKIAMGAARGLDYLHNHCKPCIIYRDMKSANILLGDGFHAKLSDLGLAKFGPTDDKTHVSTRVMGTLGYCAPEYGFTGQLTIKSDTYSFGVVLLELVTGRRALYKTHEKEEQFLIEWAKPMLIDKRKYVKLADPRMKGQFVHKSVRKAVELSLMCMNNDYKKRPDMSDVVDALDFLVSLSESLNVTAGACMSNSCCSTPVGENEGGICRSPVITVKEDSRQLGSEGQVMDPVDEMVKKKDEERAKAVAEAKLWGEKCRQDAEKLARSTAPL